MLLSLYTNGGNAINRLFSGTGGGGYPLSGAIHPYTTLDSEFDETSNSLLSRTTSIRGRFAEKEQQEGFTENRKNLPPMMQEREKDWSRRPVFAQAKSRPNIKESKTTLNLFFGKKHPVSLQALV